MANNIGSLKVNPNGRQALREVLRAAIQSHNGLALIDQFKLHNWDYLRETLEMDSLIDGSENAWIMVILDLCYRANIFRDLKDDYKKRWLDATGKTRAPDDTVSDEDDIPF